MWSAGCVLAELELGRPIFPGKSESEQLELICRTMGTFTESQWPEVEQLPHYASLYKVIPRYTNSLQQFSCNGMRLSADALMLLDRVLVPNPLKRASANNALGNRYFSQKPQAPKDPKELPPLNVTESLHEFQTKQKRRAKERAEAAAIESMVRDFESGNMPAPGAAGQSIPTTLSSRNGGSTSGLSGFLPPLPPPPPPILAPQGPWISDTSAGYRGGGDAERLSGNKRKDGPTHF